MTDGPARVVSLAERAEQRQAEGLDVKRPLDAARLLRERAKVGGWHGIANVAGGFYEWDGECWRPLPQPRLDARIYAMLEQAAAPAHRRSVGDVVHALAALSFVPGAPPFWMPGAEGPDPLDLVPLRNGLYHPAAKKLYPHTPALFNVSAAPVSFDPDATCPRWERFVGEAIPDADSRRALQQFMGVLVCSRTTKYQRALTMIGPPRSGKGVIQRTITALVGRDAVAAPTFDELGGRFGLSGLIGKTVATITDARIVPGDQGRGALQKFLALTGEDHVQVEMKYAPPQTMRLPVRLLIASNDVPVFRDASSAATARLLLIRSGASHVGTESLDLEDELAAELPGIFNWCAAGLADLEGCGRFVQPADGQALLDELRDASSPIGAFVRERCELRPDEWIAKASIFNAWCDWCREEGRNPGELAAFARALHAAAPGISATRGRDENGKRYQRFNGIRLALEPGP